MNKKLKIILIIIIAPAFVYFPGLLAWNLYQSDESYSYNIWHGTQYESQFKAKAYFYDTEYNSNLRPCVIILPGGSYHHHGMTNEGRYSARFFRKNNVFSVILKYRVSGNGHHYPSMMQDVQRTIQYLRENASDLKIDINKIGVIGYSAGGHLSLWAGEHGNNVDMLKDLNINHSVSLKPNWIASIYPVVSMQDDIYHSWSRKSLFNTTNPTKEQKDLLSLELHVPDDMPPTFLLACRDDPVVKFENTRRIAFALSAHQTDLSFNEYEYGGHGFGMMNKQFIDETNWNHNLINWLQQRKLL